MAYKITEYSKRKAKYFGLIARPSKVKGKKIDLYLNGLRVASIGAFGYPDYPTLLEMERKGLIPKGTAAARRKAYKSRHEKNRHVKGTPGFYADQILW
jgi:hypothetical protein